MNKEETKKDFNRYIIEKYGAKGRRAIRFSSRLNELDILLGVKSASKLDEEDKKYLSKEQLEELEKLKIKELKIKEK